MKKINKKILCLCLAILMVACIFSMCACNEKDKDKYIMTQNTVYTFQGDDILGNTVMSMPFCLALNLEKSFVEFKTDGTMQIKLMINDGLLAFAQDKIDIAGVLDSLNLNDIFATYVSQLFPGSSVEDLEKTFALINGSLGIGLVGFNFANEETKVLADIITKKIPMPENYQLPKNIGFEYNGPYFCKMVKSETSGEHEGIYVGKHDEDTDPYIIMTRYKTKDGVEKIMFRVEFMQIYAFLTLKK